MKRMDGRTGLAALLALLGCVAMTGCQVDMAGQTLPSPYYLDDDVQYFPPGYEFKLTREAAAMKAMQTGASSPSGPIITPPPPAPAPVPGAEAVPPAGEAIPPGM